MSANLNLTVLGAGYLGITHAAAMASLGFDVLGVDTNPGRVDQLNRGELPIYEPGLGELMRSGLAAGRLRFSTSYPAAAAFGDVHFICTGTPQLPGSSAADLSQVNSCVSALAPLLDRPCLVVGKSTVPVGTARRLAAELAGGNLAGAGICVLGAAFKPGSDDVRDSPALDVAQILTGLGARVTVYDPAAMDNARRVRPDLAYAASVAEAARDAQVVLLLTEWPEFAALTPGQLEHMVAERNIIDARNVLDPAQWREAGWEYRALGVAAGASATVHQD